MNVPEDLKYTKTHEWVKLDGDTATVGITDFAQSELGDIVFVELPAVGHKAQAGQSLGSVESVKTVSEMYSPIDGEVTTVNSALGSQSELVNTDPYGKGWILKLKVTGNTEGLLDAQTYKKEIEH